IEEQSRLLEPGMVFTIEPGLYIRPDDKGVDARWRGIGIRTEDNLLITEAGHENLTGALERSAEAVEEFIAEARREASNE
ncbi:MAG: M24 family metallopeptidase, partial [Stenotrophomonas koreensis]